MSRPRLLLLDEPSLGLAPLIVKQIFEVIARSTERQGMTILLVEQNAYHALRLAHRGYVMQTGRIVLSGTGQGAAGQPRGARRLSRRRAPLSCCRAHILASRRVVILSSKAAEGGACMHRFIRPVILAGVFVFGASAAVAQNIPIAVVGPLTGSNAAIGEQMKRGAEMAVADVNAKGGVLGKKLAGDRGRRLRSEAGGRGGQ